MRRPKARPVAPDKPEAPYPPPRRGSSGVETPPAHSPCRFRIPSGAIGGLSGHRPAPEAVDGARTNTADPLQGLQTVELLRTPRPYDGLRATRPDTRQALQISSSRAIQIQRQAEEEPRRTVQTAASNSVLGTIHFQDSALPPLPLARKGASMGSLTSRSPRRAEKESHSPQRQGDNDARTRARLCALAPHRFLTGTR